jgi:sugar transferase (PEP-CTERM/EpsH1 system associated)
MRILFLTHRLPYSPNRGDRIRAYHILRTLSTVARVDVFSLVHDDEEASHVDDVRAMADSVETVAVPRLRNLGRALAALPGPQPLTHVLLDGPAITETLSRMVASQTPDVVLAYCSGTARFALETPLDTFPLVLDMVDVDSAKWRALSGSTRPPKAWIYRREARRLSAFEAGIMQRARMTLAVNDREKNELTRLLPDARVTVVQNGIDLSAFRAPTSSDREAHVVFCGVMNYAPNADAAERLGRRIWPLVKARRPHARLLLVGTEPGARIRSLQQDPTIRVTGTVPDVRPYLWNAAVSVAPLETARGVQNKVLEAIAAGLPVVVSPTVSAGLPDEVKGACLVRDSDEAVADALLELLDATPCDRQRRVAQANLEPLTWSRQLQPLPGILYKAALTPPADASTLSKPTE